MEIRQAIKQDAPLLSSMCAEVQQLHVEHEPWQFKQPETPLFAAGFFEQILEKPDTRIFILEEADEAMGYVVVIRRDRPDNPFSYPHTYLYIDQIGVLAAQRGKGCGRALVTYVRELAERENISTITLNTWNFNTGAQAFFQAQGFETSTIQMWHRLSPEKA